MVPLGLIDVGSSVQEEVDHHAVGCLDQGRTASELVPRIDADVCAVRQQEACDRRIARSRGHRQGRLSSDARLVRISAGFEQETHHLQVTLLDWIGEKGHTLGPHGGKRYAAVAEGVEHCGVAGFDCPAHRVSADAGAVRQIGTAFDVVAERTQTDFTRVSSLIHEIAFEITLRNQKDVPIEVEVNEPIGGDWRMLRSTHDWTQSAAWAARFTVPVEAHDTTVLSYRVRVRW